jgi:hypothetical protein
MVGDIEKAIQNTGGTTLRFCMAIFNDIKVVLWKAVYS